MIGINSQGLNMRETVETVAGIKPRYPQKVLILSDAHIGGGQSNFAAYQASILTLMANYQHVILNGDNIELFTVKHNHVKDLSSMLELLTGKSGRSWRDKEFKKSGKRENYPAIENMVRGGELFFGQFAGLCPDTQLHVVGGNHENVRKFRNAMKQLQQEHTNFEWDEEAIRLGDALFTHGHLPLKHKTNGEWGEKRLREAHSREKWTEPYRMFGKPIHYAKGLLYTPPYTSGTVLEQLLQWEGTDRFHYSHERTHKPLTLDWVKHIFTGHTHHRFDNYLMEGVLHHNSGAIVHETSQDPGKLGILEATLNADGSLTDVCLVKLMKDRHSTAARG